MTAQHNQELEDEAKLFDNSIFLRKPFEFKAMLEKYIPDLLKSYSA